MQPQTNNDAQQPTPAQPGAPQPTGSKNQQPETAKQAKRNPNSSQNALLISELRDNMVIMGDGSFRAVITCKSINFDLMSSREREGIEYAYQSF